MSGYIPGEGYEKGFKCRMSGGEKPSQALWSTDPYWSEYATGWNDADDKILKEAREKHAGQKKACYKNKKFIQD